MKKIKNYGVTTLHVEECFSFLKQVETETANLPNEEPSASQTATVTTFKTRVGDFDDALKASATNPATATATAADDARDAAWRGANNYAAAMCAYPDADLRAIAEQCKAVFDKYGDPTKLAQTEESGVLHNLLQDLEALPIAEINFSVWVEDLKYKEEQFLAAAAQRTEADAARQVGIVKETRTAAEAAYRSLVDTVNALAMINGDAEYATFIDHVNAMIERQKAISKARVTRAKNEDEEQPSL